MGKKPERQSGIELLKILAMGMIVIFHVTLTLTSQHPGYPGDVFLDLSNGADGPGELILILFRGFGDLGNCIFFTASAWFLCSDSGTDWKKALRILIDVWSVSVLMLLVFLGCGVHVGMARLVKCFFPTLFSLNWYITGYLLFYMAHSRINLIINSMSQRALLSATAGLLMLYSVIGLILPGCLFGNGLLQFLDIYFAVVYMKKYLPDFSNHTRKNLAVFFLGLAGILLLIAAAVLIDSSGRGISINPMRWYSASSILTLMMTLPLFNLFRNLKFTCAAVNRLSGLTLLIYLIHENSLSRTYFRPEVFMWIYSFDKHIHIVLFTLIFAVCLFIVSAFLAWIYGKTIGRLTSAAADRLYPLLRKGHSRLMDRWLLIR